MGDFMNISRVRVGVGLLAMGILAINLSIMAGGSGAPITYADLGTQIINAHSSVGHTDNDLNEQRKIVYNLFASKEAPSTNKESVNQALRYLMHDLEIFFVPDAKDCNQTIFAQIDFTRTVFGEAALARILLSPTTDIIQLKARQDLVRELIENETLFNKLDELIYRVKEIEGKLLSYWDEVDQVTKSTIDQLYYERLKHLNKDPVALELLTRKGNFTTVYNLFSDVFQQAAMLYFVTHLIDDKIKIGDKWVVTKVNGLTVPGSLKEAFKNTYHPLALLNLSKGIFGKELDEKFLKVVREEQLDWVRFTLGYVTWFNGISAIPNLFFKYWYFKDVYKNFVLYRDTTYTLQDKLINVADLLRTIHDIDHLMNKHAVLANGILHSQQLKVLFDGSAKKISKEFATLIEMLRTGTFKGQSSFFSYTGRVLAAHKLMQLHKNKFAGALMALGEIDACLSIAKLYKRFEQERVHFAFAQYEEGNKPHINLVDFWNPQVNPAVVVPNCLELGTHGKARNVVLTGSNTGGKSTLLKAIALNLLFAQTIGIAPCSEITLTPFAYLGTSLNIVDSTSGGKSLYQAEVDRASSLIHAAREFEREGLPCFLIMDELFRGTSPEKADVETYECAKRLNTFDTTMYILATHFFNHPTRLELETDGLCKNYKIDAYIDENGNIVRTFKLEEGISKNNIAGNILQSALDNDKSQK